jgi:hypothetical protein
LSLTPGQALAAPVALDGATLLLRVAPAAPRAEWEPALDELRRTRASLGIHLTAIPNSTDPLVTATGLLAIDVPDAPGPEDVFRLEQVLARARGDHPSGELLLLGSAHARDALVAAGIEPYVHALLPLARAPRDIAQEVQDADRSVLLLPDDVVDAARVLREVVAIESSLRTAPFADRVSVAAPRSLTVEEIVARHQAFAARQGARVRTRIATGALTITFEAPGFPAPVTVTSHMVMFVAPDRTDLQQQDITVNGVAVGSTAGVPRLPIIEPERVATPPLAIALTNAYRYELAGRAQVNGRGCYVVAFHPRDPRVASFDGRAWIDTKSFAMVRVAAAQTGLRGPITASEQSDEFEPDAHGRWLLARSDIRQTYEGPSVRTPIHRLLVISANEVDPADFEARRAAAYGSNDVMLRDTPQGYRYLKRERPASAAGAAPAHAVAPTRVVTGAATRVRTLAFGVIVDPNISEPLPFAGLSYVDFDLLHTGAQLNAFFGGTFAQAAFSAPSVAGTRWQIGARAFGIATSYNDRAFERGREHYEQDIRQRPASASVWTLRPVSPRVSLRFGYDWEYTAFGRTDVTDPAFIIPSTQVVHALRAGLDVQRAGWQASGWWSPSWRTGWTTWGYGEAPQRVFQRCGASLHRSGALSPRVSGALDAAWMAGRDLDRFSRYSFGTFENRLHGYPSALVRYDRGAVLRAVVSGAVARAARLDGFVDTARVHDPAIGSGLRPYTGFGAALEVPAPFGTLLSAEWGFGVQGIDPNGRKGTHVVRISGYKVF